MNVDRIKIFFNVLHILGADISIEDCDGMTALNWSCMRGKVQAAQCLLDNGADINHSNKQGRCSLDLAAFHGNTALTQVKSKNLHSSIKFSAFVFIILKLVICTAVD